ncbi:MAG: hypothetical protein J0L78_13740 [Planctomycetes bacterium]|nr:hypothetical protein [Planctomycetota bacterium]
MEPEAAIKSVRCITCGYDLVGLTPEMACPECGISVERSIRGDLLRWRDPKYLKRLHTGAVLIQTALSLIVVAFLLQLFAAPLASTNMRGVPIIVPLLAILASIGFTVGVILYPVGWFFLTARDPGRTDDEKGQRSRRLVRLSIVFMLVSTVLAFGIGFTLPLFAMSGAMNEQLASLLLFIAGAAQIVNLLVWVLQYYASMAYLRWLAERIPSERVYKRAKLLLWLGPILLLFFCFVIPPLIAVVLYYNMLSWIRTELNAIRSEQLASAA